MRWFVAALGVLLVMAAPASAAKSKTETAQLGNIKAELDYTLHGLYKGATDVELKVFDGATQIVDKHVPDSDQVTPLGAHVGDPSVFVRDLDGDGTGEAIFDLYTGGAHCCEVSYFYKGITEISRNWGNPGYRLVKSAVTGVPYIVSADDRFTERFGSYAGSLDPVQVFRLEDGALKDVTREAGLKPTVSKEATHYKHLYRKAKAEKEDFGPELVQSSLAAYTADECTLGQCETGYQLVEHAVDRGYVRAAFEGRVRRMLARLGYDA